MDCKLYGKLSNPAVVMVGSWDPLVQGYYSLIESAGKYCIGLDYELLLVLLDPLPSNFLQNRVEPIYDCASIRIKYLSNFNEFGAVCKVSMNKTVTDGGAEYFLNELKSRFDIAELLLKKGQTLGSGPNNSVRDIDKLCKNIGIGLKTYLPDISLSETGRRVKACLADGKIAEASAFVGHLPLWKRSQDPVIAIGWKTGRYEYRATALTPDCNVELRGGTYPLDIYYNREDHTVFNWPDKDIDLIAISEAS